MDIGALYIGSFYIMIRLIITSRIGGSIAYCLLYVDFISNIIRICHDIVLFVGEGIKRGCFGVFENSSIYFFGLILYSF
jgi:hypothetical protein